MESKSEWIEKGWADIRADGEKNANRKTAKNCLLDHVSPENISRWTGLSLEEVLEIQKEL